MRQTVTGPIAALLSPRLPEGELDHGAFERNIEFLISGRVSGICINGATGEYTVSTAREREQLLALARKVINGRCSLVCGVGAAQLSACVSLGRSALERGADAVLLPPPYFFPYAQSDVEAFYREAARQIGGATIIYNLPAFTTRVETDVALRLVESVPNIIGVKDSSGTLGTLEALTVRNDLSACRLVGHDGVLCRALRENCCDGAISGVAGVLPELTVGLFESNMAGDNSQFTFLKERLNELIRQLEMFPVPWGLKLIAQYRGFFEAQFPLPLSAVRVEQIRSFESWFNDWWQRLKSGLLASTV